MNIFILDTSPSNAVKMLCDKHIVKMPLETAQLLCGVFWVFLKSSSLTQANISIPYKMTHHNHPCSVWVRESQGNFNWLIEYGIVLCKEYSYRYNKIHKSEEVIHWCDANKSMLKFTLYEQTRFVQTMPEQYRSGDPVEAYRQYYINEKYHFAKWEKGRKEPLWFKKSTV